LNACNGDGHNSGGDDGDDENDDVNGDDCHDNSEHKGDEIIDDDDIPLSHLITKRRGNSEIKRQPGATNISQEPEKRKSRKRQRNLDQWHRNIMKRNRNSGKEYVTRNGQTKRARELKPGCVARCRYKCKEKVSKHERQQCCISSFLEIRWY